MLRITTTTAILGLSMAFSQPVLAADHGGEHSKMTCTEFMALDNEGQKSVVKSMKSGRDAARAAMRGADNASADATMAVSKKADEGLDAGKDGAQEKMRGEETVDGHVKMVMKGCSDTHVMDIMMNPNR
ncbi:MAG: hypothetical protein PF483_07765 [Halothiobacillus sp.]|jgi:uncharacterized alpha-E superfamily protein|nr:hypothetical protein [Halothiobacillus sp.]